MKKNLLLISLLLCVGSICLAQNNGLKVSPLGPRGHILRVEEYKNYVMFPVQESAPDVPVKVIVNNSLDITVNIKVAVDSIDYFVPFRMDSYEGNTVSFILRQNMPRNFGRQIPQGESQAVKPLMLDRIYMSDSFDCSDKEYHRGKYHFSPAYGWMNDPNGMFYKDGEWHLFYQYNPYASVWGNMNWGHAVSRDLISWEHLPVAISPDGLGTIFSGSSVVDHSNTAGFGEGAVVAFYTSAGDSQSQSMAYSLDNGRTFVKYEGNPIITSVKRDFRDPKVFWHEGTSKWIMVLAAGNEVEFYSSCNLKEWNFESAFGKEYGSHAGVFECPDLVELPVEGQDYNKWMLVVNINPGGPSGGSATQYFTGDFDGHSFICESAEDKVKWMDYGKDHYATVSFSNAPSDRCVVMAWMSNWQYAASVPTRQYRSSNSIPRDLSLYVQDGEHYVKVLPSPEVYALRQDKVPHKVGNITKSRNFADMLLPYSNCFEMELSFTPKNSDQFSITLYNDYGESVKMTYDLDSLEFSMDRNESGLVSFSKDFLVITKAPLASQKKYQLNLFVDKCSIEVFDGAGRMAMTNLVFPTHPYTHVKFDSVGGNVNVNTLVIYPQSK